MEQLEERRLLSAAQVVGRDVFYNNSYFDGRNPAADTSDDNAIATDKQALLPGQTASFTNYTSYSKGINGVMVDIAGLGSPLNLTAADFSFKVGNSDNPGTWAATSVPTTVLVRPGDGVGGAYRVELVLPDGAIQKQWLQVTVLANTNTGLSSPDMFYFGNAAGESGNSPSNTFVDGSDFAGARDDPHNFITRASITNVHDYNRDSFVDGSDLAVARDNYTNFLTSLKLVNLIPVLTAALANDTGTSTSDGITSSPTVAGQATNPSAIASLATGLDSTPIASYTDVTASMSADGTFVLNPSQLAQINGGPLNEGRHTLHFQARDNLSQVIASYDLTFTLDTQPPSVTNQSPAPGSVIAAGTNNVDVTFSEPSANILASSLALSGSAAAQATIGVPVILSGNTWRFPISGLVNGTLNLSVAGPTDLAGNLVQPSSWTYDVGGVQFADPVLAAAVRAELGIGTGQLISPAALASLNTLSVDSNTVHSLSGLEAATSLNTLRLTPAEWSAAATTTAPDLSPLANLSYLSTLTLQRVGLSSTGSFLSQLGLLTNLRSLDLTYNHLQNADLASLRGLTHLTTLSLHGNAVSDLISLGGIPTATDLIPGGGGAQSLSGGLSTAATAVTLAAWNPSWPTSPFEVQVDSETVLVTGGFGTINLTVTRGVEGTSAASHFAGARVVMPNDESAQSISELAAALHHSPLEIFRYVYNNFEYQLYPGLMKGAQATLETRAGNDWDQSGLLIGLLQASGVPARYVSGRLQAYYTNILQQWLDVSDPGAGGLMIRKAGLNPDSASGYLDHTWVEAQLSGSNNWTSLDPSFKYKSFTAGITDIDTKVPFDEAGYLSTLRPQSALEYYEGQVRSYLAANAAGKTLSDVGYQGSIIPTTSIHGPILPSSVTARYDNFVTVPSSWKFMLEVTLKNGANTLFDQSFVVAETSLQRITISYVPTAQDKGIVDSYGGLGKTPAGAVHVIPQLRQDGILLAQGAPLSYLNDQVQVNIQADGPADIDFRHETSSVSRQAGAFIAIGVDALQTSARSTARKIEQINIANAAYKDSGSLDGEKQIGGLLELGITLAFQQDGQERRDLAFMTQSADEHYKLGFGLTSGLLPASDRWDLPFPVMPLQPVLDIRSAIYLSSSLQGLSQEQYTRVNSILGWSGSSHESLLWGELTNAPGLSTVSSLQAAHDRGIPVFEINSSNENTYLPQLRLLASDVAAIRREIDTFGNTITVPRDPTPFDGIDGVGYFSRGGTGGGGYLVSGNSYGGYGGSAQPPPAVPTDNISNSATCGDPINISNGNVQHDESDLVLPGVGMPLALSRHYDSQSTTDPGMGQGWSFSYGDHLEIKPDRSAAWTDDQGHHFTFTPAGFINGKQAVDFPGRSDAASGVAVQSDGKIVVAGMSDRDFAVTRLNADGTLDRSFGIGGRATTDFLGGVDTVWAVALQADGGILVAGDAGNPGQTTRDFALARFTPTGILDWKTTTSFGDIDYATVMIVQNDGKIVLGGNGQSGGSHFALARYNLDGTLDVTFGDGGKVLTNLGGADEGMRGLCIDSAGRLVAVGYSSTSVGYFVAAARYLTADGPGGLRAGQLDPTFGVGGTEKLNVLTNSDTPLSAALQSDDKIIVGGESVTVNGRRYGFIARLTANGGDLQADKLDMSFGSGGVVQVDPGGNSDLHAVQIQPDGKILANLRPGPGSDFYIVRFNANGSPDVDFGVGGTVQTDFGGNDQAEAQALYSSRFAGDGRFVVVGSTSAGASGTSDFAIARYNADGTPDTSVAQGYATPNTLHGDFTKSPTGYIYRNKDGFTHLFDNSGLLTEIRDRNGNAITIAHDAVGHITTVTEANATTHRLTFTYTGDHITSIADFTGRAWLYSYTGNQLVSVTAPSDAQTPQAVTRYDYFTGAALGGLLRQITNPNGGATNYSYYPDRRGFQVVDAEGNVQTVTYNLFRQQTHFIDERGNDTTYSYNLDGNLLNVNYADLSNESYVWQDQLMRSKTDAFGKTETFDFDALGNLTRTIDRAGIQTDFSYDPTFSNVTGITKPGGRVTAFGYDANGNQTRITDALGDVTTMTYDPHGQMLTRTTPKGNLTAAPGGYTTTLTYSDAGQILTRSTDLPSVITNTYDARGSLLASTDANGHMSSFTSDLLGRPLTSTDALNHTSTQAYDAGGRRISVTDALSRTVTFVFDRRDHLTGTTYADGTSTAAAYDAIGNLSARIDELGRAVVYAFDSRNRLSQTLFADGSSGRIRYDGGGRTASTTDALGNTTRFTYDADDRPLTITNALGNTVTREYDAVGNLKSVTSKAAGDPVGRKTQYVYDLLNRVTTVTDPLNKSASTEYDENGNVKKVTDPLGHATRYGYDVLDRRITVTDARNFATTTVYDPAGNTLRITDASGNATGYTYDSLNRLLTETNALNDARIYGYDAVGNLVSLTDRNGRLRQYTYDLRNHRTAELWLNGSNHIIRTISSSFDAVGELTRASDPDSTYLYTYDLMGRVSMVDNLGTPGVPRVTLAYGYDLNGNRTNFAERIGGPPGSPAFSGIVQYTYDALNRMTQLSQQNVGVSYKRVKLTYDGYGELTGIQRYALVGNLETLVATTAYGFDTLGRLGSLSHTNPSNATIAQYGWVFDDAGRLTQATTPDGISNYAYDETNQLTGADHSSQADETYAYDATGNRTNTGYSTSGNNRLASDGVNNYEYDKEGNRTKSTEIGTGKSTEYTWDYRNRLTQVVFKDAAGNIIKDVSYIYDTSGRRLAKSVDADGAGPGAAVIDRYVYDGDNIALQFDGASAQTHRYLYGPAIDQVLADESAGGVVHWMLADHEGTVRDIIDSGGNLINHIVYDSFGRTTSESTPAARTIYGYTGRQRDDETGLYYYRARYYDTANGRFLSEDPAGFAAGDVNLSRYVTNSPTNFVDPTGFQQETPISTQFGDAYETGKEVYEFGKVAYDVYKAYAALTGSKTAKMRCLLETFPEVLSTPALEVLTGNKKFAELAGEVISTSVSLVTAYSKAARSAAVAQEAVAIAELAPLGGVTALTAEAAALAAGGAAVIAAGGVGYALGSLINHYLPASAQDAIGGTVAEIVALWENPFGLRK